jgi:hypothetical protein
MLFFLFVFQLHRSAVLLAVLYDDMGRGSTDMSYTWNEYGRPAIDLAYSAGHLAQAGLIDAVVHGGDISYAQGKCCCGGRYEHTVNALVYVCCICC